MEIGDEVRIKRIRPGTYSGTCLFVEDMKKFHGLTATIKYIDKHNYVKLSGPRWITGYSFKTDWLEIKPKEFLSDKDFEI